MIKVKGSSGKTVRMARLNDIQKMIVKMMESNRERYGLTSIGSLSHLATQTNNTTTTTTTLNNLQPNNLKSNSLTRPDDQPLKINDLSSDDELLSPKCIAASTKSTSDQCVVLEVDDGDDADIVSLMIDPEVPKSFEICNTDKLPTSGNESFLAIYQTFNKVFRAKITNAKQFSAQFDWIIQSLFVKLRRLTPCALAGLRFKGEISIYYIENF